MKIEELSEEVEQYIIKEPRFFSDIIRNFSKEPYRGLLLAWSIIREKDILKRDDEGHYIIEPEI